jgi:hypothetical protein
MSRFGRKTDGILEGAEGRSLTQVGPSTRQRKRGAFYEPLDDFVARRTAQGGASPMD